VTTDDLLVVDGCKQYVHTTYSIKINCKSDKTSTVVSHELYPPGGIVFLTRLRFGRGGITDSLVSVRIKLRRGV